MWSSTGRSPMETGISTAPVLIACLSLVFACGGSDTEFVPIEWAAGDLDPFGCPYVDPEPWVSEETHEAACGEGCPPFALGTGSGEPMFVACVSDDLAGFPPTIGGDAEICLTHPVTDERYTFGQVSWGVLGELCWGACSSGEPWGDPRDGCFEPAP